MPHTAYIAALLGLLLIALTLPVIRLRASHRISLGDGGNSRLLVAIRAHGNTVEAVPIFLILLYFLELSGLASALAVWLLGGVFLACRLLYCLGLYRRLLPARLVGFGLGLLLQLGMAITILLPF